MKYDRGRHVSIFFVSSGFFMFCFFFFYYYFISNVTYASIVQACGLGTVMFALCSAGFGTVLLKEISLYIKSQGLQTLALIDKLKECNSLQKPSVIIYRVLAELSALSCCVLLIQKTRDSLHCHKLLAMLKRMVTEEQLYCTGSQERCVKFWKKRSHLSVV